MMKKMILAAVAAVTLAGATQSASAGGYGYGGYGYGNGHNWGGGYQNSYYGGYQQHCTWQRIKVRDHYGNWIWKRVRVCH